MLNTARSAAIVLATLVVAVAPSITRARACEDLVLGAALSATGIYASNGNNTKNGYEFAVKKINEAGASRSATSAITSRSPTMTTNPRRLVLRNLLSA